MSSSVASVLSDDTFEAAQEHLKNRGAASLATAWWCW